jgi:large subunit ribosomal protein L33
VGKTGARVGVRMVSTAGTGHSYMTSKNRRTTPGRLELRKYDPVVRRHVLYRESR